MAKFRSGSSWGQSAFESGPPPSGDDAENAPIGVKSGYEARLPAGDPSDDGLEEERAAYGRERGLSPRTRAQPATFYEDDIDRPGSQSPERIAQLQAALVQGGLLKAGAFRLGVWDTPTRNAYKEVLAHANRTGLTSAEESLGAFLNSPATQEASERAPFRAELPNPDDLRKEIDEIATETSGRGISAEERELVVRTYTALIAKKQREGYDTALTGGAITDAPSFDTYAENEVRRLRPVESGAKDMAKLSEQFLEAIRATPGDVDRVF